MTKSSEKNQIQTFFKSTHETLFFYSCFVLLLLLLLLAVFFFSSVASSFLDAGLSEELMPPVVGAVGLFVGSMFLILLDSSPDPRAKDLESRSARLPMPPKAMLTFFRDWWLGFTCLIISFRSC